ncbi:MAG: type II secretion system protein [Planctomycetota bacterium]|jgi:prepilin-type N-terminal cleavage/methylation domain-containing protein
MCKKKGFTLIELLVVIAIIALLMSILMPALSKAKEQARTAVCLSNNHQWAIIWKLYTDEYKGRLPQGLSDWVEAIVDFEVASAAFSPSFAAQPVFARAGKGKYEPLLRCPSAARPAMPPGRGGVYGGRNNAWVSVDEDDDGVERIFIGSYGANQYITSSTGGGRIDEELWKTITVKGAAYVPIMLDAARPGLTPTHLDQPPEWDGQIYYSNPHDIDEIRGFCINRLLGYVCGIFMDFHARRIGLKELWLLHWSRDWPIPASHPLPDWPIWMEPLPDPF